MPDENSGGNWNKKTIDSIDKEELRKSAMGPLNPDKKYDLEKFDLPYSNRINIEIKQKIHQSIFENPVRTSVYQKIERSLVVDPVPFYSHDIFRQKIEADGTLAECRELAVDILGKEVGNNYVDSLLKKAKQQFNKI